MNPLQLWGAWGKQSLDELVSDPTGASVLTQAWGVLHAPFLFSYRESVCWKKREVITATWEALCKGKEGIQAYILQTLKTLGALSPTSQTAKTRDDLFAKLIYLPFPYEQMRALQRSGCHDFSQEEVFRKFLPPSPTSASKKSLQQELQEDVDTFFAFLEGKKEIKDLDLLRLEKTLGSRGALIIDGTELLLPEGVYLSWIEGVKMWIRDCPEAKEQKERWEALNKQFSFTHFLENEPLPKKTYKPSSTTLSFQEYMVELSLDSIWKQLKLKPIQAISEQLFKIFAENDEARREVLAYLFFPCFTDFKEPSYEFDTGFFLSACQLYLKLRPAFEDTDGSELFTWIYDFERETRFDEIATYSSLREDILDVFVSARSLFLRAETPAKEKLSVFHALLTLTKQEQWKDHLANLVIFFQNLKIQNFEARGPFLSLHLEAYAPPYAYDKLLDIFVNTQEIRKRYKQEPNPSFWAKLAALKDPPAILAKVNRFCAFFPLDQGKSINAPHFDHALLKFIAGELTEITVETLMQFVHTSFSETISYEIEFEALSTLKISLQQAPSNPERIYREETMQVLDTSYSFLPSEKVHLFMHLLSLSQAEMGEKRIILTTIERYMGFPLLSRDVFGFFLIPLNEQTLQALKRSLATFVTLRTQMLSTSTVSIDPQLNNQIGEQVNFWLGLDPHTNDFLTKTLTRLIVLLQRATRPFSSQPFSDFLTWETATQGTSSLLLPFSKEYPDLIHYRRWFPPQGDQTKGVFLYTNANMRTGETFNIFATLDIPWKEMVETPEFFPLLRQMGIDMGVGESPSQAALSGIFEQDVVHFPEVLALWNKLSVEHQKVGQKFYTFVTQLNLGARRACVALAESHAHLLSLLQEPCFTGHIYNNNGALSLVSVRAPALLPSQTKLYTLPSSAHYVQLIEKQMQSLNKEVSGNIFIEDHPFLQKLVYLFSPGSTFLEEEEKGKDSAAVSPLNTLTLSLFDAQENVLAALPIVYRSYLSTATLLKRLAWHLQMTLAAALKLKEQQHA